MTAQQAIAKLRIIRANLVIASTKVARSGTLRPKARLSISNEYLSRVEALDYAIKAIEK